MIYFIKVYGKSSSPFDKIIICWSSFTYIAQKTDLRQRDGHLVYDSDKFFISRAAIARQILRALLSTTWYENLLSHSCNYSITDCLEFPGIIPVYYRGNSLLRLIYDRFNHPLGFFLSPPPPALQHVYLRSGVYDAVDLVYVLLDIFSTGLFELSRRVNPWVKPIRGQFVRPPRVSIRVYFALLCELSRDLISRDISPQSLDGCALRSSDAKIKSWFSVDDRDEKWLTWRNHEI